MRAYLAAHPELAAQFGMAASAASRPGANPMCSLSSTYPQRSSSSYSGAVSGGSGPASARAANAGPTLRETLASMGSSLRKRFDTLSARFKRSQTGASKAPPSASSGTFLGGLFDSRGGQYAQLPVAEGGPLNPVRREAFVDYAADDRDDVEIELMGGGGGSAHAAGDTGAAAVPTRSTAPTWAAADAPASSSTAAAAWAASLNSGGGGGGKAINAPGVVSTNPVFAIGEDSEDEERTSLTSPKNRHI